MNTYKLLDVHDYSNEGNLLLLNSLRHQLVLEQVRIVDVGANVASFSLLALQSFLALPGTRRQ